MKEIKWTEEQDKLIDEMADDIKPNVDEIEDSIQTTKNHYGKYMSIIGEQKAPVMKRVMAEVLIRAGANYDGVVNGYNIASGNF